MLGQQNLAKIEIVGFLRWSHLNGFLQRLHGLLRPALLVLAPAQQIEQGGILASGVNQRLKKLLALAEFPGVIFDQRKVVLQTGPVWKCRSDGSK